MPCFFARRRSDAAIGLTEPQTRQPRRCMGVASATRRRDVAHVTTGGVVSPGVLPSLAVAIAGLVLAAVALTWQAATFLLTGSRLKVDSRQGATDGRGIVHGMPGSESIERLRAQGYTHEVLGAEVFNRGRTGVSVTGIRAVTSRGISFAPIADLLGPPMPHRLEPGASASWFFPLAPVRAAIATSAEELGHPNPDDVAIDVDSGDGRRRRAKRKLRVSG